MSLRSHWPAQLAIHPRAFLAPGAIVTGEVSIGARSSVWFHTVVRGDTDRIEIGEWTNLQDLTMVHVDEGQPAQVGSRVTVGHRAIVHGCVVENDCLIGMGAVVLSGARIGAGSLVAAGALVREGQEIAPGSLVVGAPARALGPVKDAHVEAIRRGFEHYAELADEYVRRGFARPHPAPGSDLGTAAPWAGPMGHTEWRGLVATLARGPDAVTAWVAAHPEAAWRRRPSPARWSALETLGHLRDVDVEVYGPRLRRLLDESEPELVEVPAETWVAERGAPRDSAAALVESWRAAREALVRTLRPLGPDAWSRFGWHSLHGPYPLGEMVRGWAEHDLGHLRQIALAIGEQP